MPSPRKLARDPAAEITSLLIARLEEGVAPWRRPWQTTEGGERPLRHCGTPYTGINTLYLWALADAQGYQARHWMTYRQAVALGGQVRRGERGAISVYYSALKRTESDPETGEASEQAVRFLRAYTVFNADQIDGLPDSFYPRGLSPEPPLPSARQAAIDRFFADIPATVRHGGKAAYFNSARDFIQLPHATLFVTADHYASTRAHETVHWSGAPTRLARTFGRRFGDRAYAFEELIAEIGAGLICADLRLPATLHDSHASYIDHWLKILRSDKTAIIHAASKAEQAWHYLREFGAVVDQPTRLAA